MTPMRGMLAVVTLVVGAWGQRIDVTRTAPNPIANFDLSYIDITGRGAGPTLFQLQVSSPDPRQVYFIRFTATTSNTALPDGALLLRAQSGHFRVPQGQLRLSSNAFLADHGDSSAGLHTTLASLDEQLRTTLLAPGLLPPGRITLAFELFTESAAAPLAVSTTETWFDIIAVRYVKLVSPGVDAGAAPDRIPHTFSPYPQFVWSSDLQPIHYPPGSVKFVLEVYENPDNRYSADDITTSRPVWTDTVPGESNVNYAQYPIAGARALQPGHTYYWRIGAVLQGPVSRQLSSGLNAFIVADPNVTGTLSPTQAMILRYLTMILGSNYGYVIDQLKHMSPDETIRIGGRQVSIEQLAQLAEQFALGERRVTNVEID